MSADPPSFQAPGRTTVTGRIPVPNPNTPPPTPPMDFRLTGPGGTQSETDASAEGEYVDGSGDPDLLVAYRYEVTFAVEVPGEHTITATAEGNEPGSTTVTALAPPVTVQLVQDSETSEVGQTVTLTASADNTGSDGHWIVAVEGPNAQTLSDSSANPLTVSYSGEVEGVDRIVATWVEGRQRPSDELRHAWTRRAPPPAVVSVTVSPADRSIVGSTATVTASVTGGSGGGEGYWVIDVTGVNGPRRILGAGELPPRGQSVTAEYIGEAAGTDTITATWTDDDRLVGQARNSVEHVWDQLPPPTVLLGPGGGSSLVGTPLELTLTVTGGEGRGGGRPSVTVGGANAGVQPEISGESSPFTVRYTGTRTGEDTVTVIWTDQVGATPATATHTWTAPRVQLTAGGGAADLGDTATVRVALPDGALGGAVEIEVLEGPHRGPLEVQDSEDGFEATYTGRFPGTDRIRATLVTERFGSFPSDVGSQGWATPVVVLEQSPGRSLVGDTHTVTARVTGTRTGDVGFRVAGANAGATVDRTGGLPAVRGTYTGRAEGVDQITAEVTVNGRRYSSAEVGHAWVRPTVVLSQDTETSKTGETVVLTATVAPSGVTGAVVFSVAGPGGPLTFRDDGADGSWTASYSRDREGEDTVTAVLSGGSGLEFTAGAIRHRWAAVVPPAVVVAPAGVTTCTGSTYSPTVTVTDEEEPVAQAPVRLVVTPAEGAPQEFRGTTDADGHVTLPHQGTAAGRETLVATAEVRGTPVESAPLPHVWEDCALQVGIAPAGTTSPVGSTFEPTVTVRDTAGAPVADARVELQVTTADQPPVTLTLQTGPSGTASAAYRRDAAGTDRIDVVVTAGERTGRATAEHFWVETGGLQVSITPAGTTSTTGSPFTATVLVTDGQRPVEDAQVIVRATMSDVVAPDAAGPVVEQQGATGADGQTSATFTRAVAGTDTVLAEVRVGERSGRAAIVHFWQQVPGLTLEVGPAGASTEVGTDFTATVTVRLGDEPAPGLAVAVRTTMDGQPEQTGTVTTGEDGRASWTYRRDTVGPDVVSATVTLPDGRVGENAVGHLWWAADPEAPVEPEPVDPAALDVQGTPVPDGLVTLRGSGCPAGAPVQLLIDGEVVATPTARRDGSYSAEVRLAGLGVGRYPLEAVCVPVRVPRTIDVVVPVAASGTAAAGAATAATVLSFFVLLGGQLIRLSSGQPGTGS